MSLKTTVALMIGVFLILFSSTSAFAAGDDACSLLTQTQVSSVLAFPSAAGSIPVMRCTFHHPIQRSTGSLVHGMSPARTVSWPSGSA